MAQPRHELYPDEDDSIIAPCSNVDVELGIFFDGTQNNHHSVAANQPELGGSFGHNFTHVYRLNLLYPRETSSKKETNFVYVRGISTNSTAVEPKEDSGYGGATGQGETGIDRQIQEAFNQIRERLNTISPNNTLCNLTLDVFGFSRGAATARYFCNLIRDGHFEGVNVKVRFLGLFDTVGSLGIPGNEVEAGTILELYLTVNPLVSLVFRETGWGIYDLNIHPDSAENVVHFTAGDEFRYFFPSRSALPPGPKTVEVMMPGCHGDVAGDVSDEIVEDVWENPPPDLIARGYFDRADKSINHTPRHGRNPAVDTPVFTRRVKPYLGNASLKAMHSHAVKAGAPLRPLADLVNFNTEIPPELEVLTALLTAGSPIPENVARPIRAKFVHMGRGGLGVDMHTFTGNRKVIPNDPQ